MNEKKDRKNNTENRRLAINDAAELDASIQERAERLKTAVQLAGGNNRVAYQADMPVGTLNRYIAGRDMKASAMIALAKACRVSLDWLADGVGNMKPSNQDIDAPSLGFPLYDVEFSAGYGFEDASQNVKELFHVPKASLSQDIIAQKNHIIAATVKGDSMAPTLSDGDIILILNNVRKIVRDNAIYVIRIEDALLVKRLRRLVNGNIQVVSDNSNYPTEELNAEHFKQMSEDGGIPAKIIGQVVWRSGHVGE